MPSQHSASMVTHRRPIQTSSSLQHIRRNRVATLLLRTLASGLFFLMLVSWASPAFSVDLSLAWDPNTEADLEGYGLYFRKGAPGPPYNLFGYVTTDELGDPANPSFTVTGLEKGARYYLALTAYDTTGAESAFSSAVCADVGDTIAPCPSAGAGDGGGGGGSGGGGACFIGTSRGDSGHFDSWMAGLASLVSMAALARFAHRRFSRSFLFSRYEARQSCQRRSNL